MGAVISLELKEGEEDGARRRLGAIMQAVDLPEGVTLGDKLQFLVAGQEIELTVASTRRVNWDSFQPNFFMVLSPGALDGYPATFVASLKINEADEDVAPGESGELLVRHSAATPRAGAFSGYLKDAQATEEGWRGGWWHTGDVVRQSPDGMLHFVDRKKNIIRRSGENIAAAEIEARMRHRGEAASEAWQAVAGQARAEALAHWLTADYPTKLLGE